MELAFGYTVVEGDISTDGVAVLRNTLELNGGAIRSATAITVEDARLGHKGLDHNSTHKVVTPNTAAPLLVSASVTGTTLTLTFSESLSAAASLANSAFTVKKTPQGAPEQTVSLSGSPVIDGATVTLMLASAVLDTDAGVMVSYEKPVSGTRTTGWLTKRWQLRRRASLDRPVRSVADTTQPRMVRGTDRRRHVMTIYFSEPLDEDSGERRGDYLPDQSCESRQPWRSIDHLHRITADAGLAGSRDAPVTTEPREVRIDRQHGGGRFTA